MLIKRRKTAFPLRLCPTVFDSRGTDCEAVLFKARQRIRKSYPYGVTYLTIVCICSIGMFTQMTFEKLLQSTGRTMYTMITQSLGAVINIIFDPILIFGLFGFPKMGVADAAAATVFGQIVAAGLAIIFNLKVNKDIHLNFRKFRPEKK